MSFQQIITTLCHLYLKQSQITFGTKDCLAVVAVVKNRSSCFCKQQRKPKMNFTKSLKTINFPIRTIFTHEGQLHRLVVKVCMVFVELDGLESMQHLWY